MSSSTSSTEELNNLRKKVAELEEQLEDKNLILRNILHGMLAGYWDWHIPSEYEYMSPSFKRMLGYEDHEIPNHPDSWPMLVHPDDLAGIMEAFDQHVQTKGESPFDLESRFVHKNGAVLWVHCQGRVIEWDEEDNPIRMVGNHVNITNIKKSQSELKKTQQALLDNAKKFEIAANATGMGTWELDLSTMTCYWDKNLFKIHQIEGSENPNHYDWLKNFVHPEDQSLITQCVEKALESYEKFDVQFRIFRTDGEMRYIKSVVHVDLNEEGIPYKLMGTNIDITRDIELERQKIRAEQLEQKNKELEQFAYIASHDMQEPLRTVQNFVGLINKKYQHQIDQDADKYLSFITNATDRMRQLVKGLLDYSRIGVSKKLQKVSVENLINEVRMDIKAVIQETNTTFSVGKLPTLSAYGTELRVLFQNLILNSIKFQRPGTPPHIQIDCQETRTHWRFSISDNGIGIAEENQDKIFIIFQRLHRNNEIQGTGIGLAHCQRIVGLHDGKIWVNSAPNQGSTFYFTIAKHL